MAATGERPRGSLNRAEVLAKATEIADRDGAEALTMRRLAGELGVGVMTLYGHVRTKDELLDGVVEMVLGRLVVPVRGSWHERLLQLCVNLRALLHRHPTILHARPHGPMTGPGGLRAVDAALGLVREAGLDGEDAVDGASGLVAYTFGAALLRPDPGAEGRRQYERDVRGADPAELPHLSSLAAPFLTRDGADEAFVSGARLIIAGLAARGMAARGREPR